MEGYLRAVFWLAGREEGGGEGGKVVVWGGRGEERRVPKGEKEEGVRGRAVMVMVEVVVEGAIVGGVFRW